MTYIQIIQQREQTERDNSDRITLWNQLNGFYWGDKIVGFPVLEQAKIFKDYYPEWQVFLLAETVEEIQ